MDKKRTGTKRPRTRTRPTDFHGIENPPQGRELSGYELEVREKLAEGLSPLDQMIEEEEALEMFPKQVLGRKKGLRFLSQPLFL